MERSRAKPTPLANGEDDRPGSLGGGSSEALAINERGPVVGQSTTSAGQWHAFLWERGTMIDLGTLGGASSVATLLNEKGQVAGFDTEAVLWTT
jgi:probable HAF family extracellular repeat protein